MAKKASSNKNFQMKNKNKNKNRKIYVVGPSVDYANWCQGTLVNKMEQADLVMFTGGEDVSPELYNQPEHHTTFANPHRDRYEVVAYKRAVELNKPKIGICRGHQFLCAMAGGILIQHQSNPRSFHPIKTVDGETLIITSLHHQAAYPWVLPADEFKILAWANGESEYHFGGNNEELAPVDGKEVEIIHFPKIRAYGIQGHPEMMFGQDHPEIDKTITYLRNQLDLFMADKL
jgi:gamma-glutamyl-gamma-aminobutyrate hydrolase PuuD